MKTYPLSTDLGVERFQASIRRAIMDELERHKFRPGRVERYQPFLDDMSKQIWESSYYGRSHWSQMWDRFWKAFLHTAEEFRLKIGS